MNSNNDMEVEIIMEKTCCFTGHRPEKITENVDVIKATMVFGLAFWGTALPKYRKFIEAGGDPDRKDQVSFDDIMSEYAL